MFHPAHIWSQYGLFLRLFLLPIFGSSARADGVTASAAALLPYENQLLRRAPHGPAYMLYINSNIKGCRNIGMLSGRIPTLPNRFTSQDFADNGWTISSSEMSIPPRGLHAAFMQLGASEERQDNVCITAKQDKSGHTHKKYGSVPAGAAYDASDGEYVNCINWKAGLLWARYNRSPTYWKRYKPAIEIPPLHRFSDVVSIIYGDEVRPMTQRSRLTTWIRWAEEESVTYRVMEYICQQQPQQIQEPPTYTQRLQFEVDHKFGKALLGTPQGVGVTWALASNYGPFDGWRTVKAISMFSGPSVVEGERSWYLLFEIGDRPTGAPPPTPLPPLGYEPIPDIDATTFEQARKRGSRNFELMSGERVPNLQQFVEDDLPTNGWSVTIGPHDAAPLLVNSPDWEDILAFIGATEDGIQLIENTQDKSGHTNKEYRGHPENTRFSATQAYYHNYFDTTAGVVMSGANMSPTFVEAYTPHAPDFAIPPLHFFSDVVVLNWFSLLQTKHNLHQPPAIRWWLRMALPESDAMKAMRWVCRQKKTREPPLWANRWTFEPKGDGSILAHGLMGTSLGNGVAWALATSPVYVGGYREVVKIHLFRSDVDPDYLGRVPWHLLFEIRARPPERDPIHGVTFHSKNSTFDTEPPGDEGEEVLFHKPAWGQPGRAPPADENSGGSTSVDLSNENELSYSTNSVEYEPASQDGEDDDEDDDNDEDGEENDEDGEDEEDEEDDKDEEDSDGAENDNKDDDNDEDGE